MPHQRVTRGAALAGIGASALVFLAARARPRSTPQIFSFRLSEAAWRKRLGPQRYAILREAGTERPGSSPLEYEHRRGIYACAGCDLPLYSSTTKFESGTGWPSFFRPLPNALQTRSDYAIGEARTEVLCRRCGGHLGHVFPDGPPPTGLRYCMNGLALVFQPQA